MPRQRLTSSSIAGGGGGRRATHGGIEAHPTMDSEDRRGLRPYPTSTHLRPEYSRGSARICYEMRGLATQAIWHKMVSPKEVQCSSAEMFARFGSVRSEVQILSPRLIANPAESWI